MFKSIYLRQVLSPLLALIFLFNSFPYPNAIAGDMFLPAPGILVPLSPSFDPPILKGIKIRPDNPLRFDFILDKGEGQLSNDALKEESSKLIKYFLASLTIPEKDLWVNLSPYEKDRIIPNSFGLTEMGRDLLAEDYMLKQITASLIYPDDEIGKRFWKRIYEEAEKKFGTTNIPVNTFNKVWIVPSKAVVYENAKAGTAYVLESKLKVMLEQDYLSLEKHKNIQANQDQTKNTNQLGSQIVREIVIPELTKEVNENKNFSQLRQVYNSLILATWYKKKIKDSILEKVYADKKKIVGVNIDDPQETQKIYQQYLKAFKKGVYNYIKEDFDPITNQSIPRKYFSGGFGATDFAEVVFATVHHVDTAQLANKSLLDLSVNFAMAHSNPAGNTFNKNKAMAVREVQWVFLDWDGNIAEERGSLSQQMVMRLVGLLRQGKKIVILTDTITSNHDSRMQKLIDAVPVDLLSQLTFFTDSSAKGTGFDQEGQRIDLEQFNKLSRFSEQERNHILAVLEEDLSGQFREEQRGDRRNPEYRIDLITSNKEKQKSLVKTIQLIFNQRGWPYKVYMGDTEGNIRIVKSHKEDAVKWILKENHVQVEQVLIMANEGRQGEKDHELLTFFPNALNVNVGKFSKSLLRANPHVVQLPTGIQSAQELLDILAQRGGIPGSFLLNGQVVDINHSPKSEIVYLGKDVEISYEGSSVFSGPVFRPEYQGPGVRFAEVFDLKFSPNVQEQIADRVAQGNGEFIILSEQEALNGGVLIKKIAGKDINIRLAGHVPITMPNFLELTPDEQNTIFSRFSEGARSGWEDSATDQFVSSASLNRIKIGDGYLFMRQKDRNGEIVYAPLGGAYQYSPQILDFFKSIGAYAFSQKNNDIRFMLPTSKLSDFKNWFDRKSFREYTPFRELREEMVREGHLFDDQTYKDIFDPSHRIALNRLTPVVRTDIFDEFHREEGLGSNTEVVFIIKNANGGPVSARRRGQKKAAEDAGQYYSRERIGGHREGGGNFMIAPLENIVNERLHEQHLNWTGSDPYAYDQRKNIVYVGDSDAIYVINRSTGDTERIIKNPKLSSVHSLEISTQDPNIMLVCSEGSNQIYEININTGEIVWAWDPYKHGYSKNKLGLTLIDKHDPIPQGDHVRILNFQEAEDMMAQGQRVPDGETYVYVVDFDHFDQVRGLPRWARTVRPNWSGYRYGKPGKIFATLFNPGEAVEIDKKTGAVKVLWSGLISPHGVIHVKDGFLISDTGWGRVLFYNNDFELKTVFDFSRFPQRNSMEEHKYEWLQNTYPLTIEGKEYLVSVDSRRNTIYVWDPISGVYSDYKYNPNWIVQAVMPVSDKASVSSTQRVDNAMASNQVLKGAAIADYLGSGRIFSSEDTIVMPIDESTPEHVELKAKQLLNLIYKAGTAGRRIRTLNQMEILFNDLQDLKLRHPALIINDNAFIPIIWKLFQLSQHVMLAPYNTKRRLVEYSFSEKYSKSDLLRPKQSGYLISNLAKLIEMGLFSTKILKEVLQQRDIDSYAGVPIVTTPILAALQKVAVIDENNNLIDFAMQTNQNQAVQALFMGNLPGILKAFEGNMTEVQEIGFWDQLFNKIEEMTQYDGTIASRNFIQRLEARMLMGRRALKIYFQSYFPMIEQHYLIGEILRIKFLMSHERFVEAKKIINELMKRIQNPKQYGYFDDPDIGNILGIDRYFWDVFNSYIENRIKYLNNLQDDFNKGQVLATIIENIAEVRELTNLEVDGELFKRWAVQLNVAISEQLRALNGLDNDQSNLRRDTLLIYQHELSFNKAMASTNKNTTGINEPNIILFSDGDNTRVEISISNDEALNPEISQSISRIRNLTGDSAMTSDGKGHWRLMFKIKEKIGKVKSFLNFMPWERYVANIVLVGIPVFTPLALFSHPENIGAVVGNVLEALILVIVLYDYGKARFMEEHDYHVDILESFYEKGSFSNGHSSREAMMFYKLNYPDFVKNLDDKQEAQTLELIAGTLSEDEVKVLKAKKNKGNFEERLLLALGKFENEKNEFMQAHNKYLNAFEPESRDRTKPLPRTYVVQAMQFYIRNNDQCRHFLTKAQQERIAELLAKSLPKAQKERILDFGPDQPNVIQKLIYWDLESEAAELDKVPGEDLSNRAMTVEKDRAMVVHKNLLSKNAYDLPTDIFGGKNVNLIDIFAQAWDAFLDAYPQIPRETKIIFQPRGSVNYAVTDTGSLDWRYITNFEFVIYLPDTIPHEIKALFEKYFMSTYVNGKMELNGLEVEDEGRKTILVGQMDGLQKKIEIYQYPDDNQTLNSLVKPHRPWKDGWDPFFYEPLTTYFELGNRGVGQEAHLSDFFTNLKASDLVDNITFEIESLLRDAKIKVLKKDPKAYKRLAVVARLLGQEDTFQIMMEHFKGIVQSDNLFDDEDSDLVNINLRAIRQSQRDLRTQFEFYAALKDALRNKINNKVFTDIERLDLSEPQIRLGAARFIISRLGLTMTPDKMLELLSRNKEMTLTDMAMASQAVFPSGGDAVRKQIQLKKYYSDKAMINDDFLRLKADMQKSPGIFTGKRPEEIADEYGVLEQQVKILARNNRISLFSIQPSTERSVSPKVNNIRNVVNVEKIRAETGLERKETIELNNGNNENDHGLNNENGLDRLLVNGNLPMTQTAITANSLLKSVHHYSSIDSINLADIKSKLDEVKVISFDTLTLSHEQLNINDLETIKNLFKIIHLIKSSKTGLSALMMGYLADFIQEGVFNLKTLRESVSSHDIEFLVKMKLSGSDLERPAGNLLDILQKCKVIDPVIFKNIAEQKLKWLISFIDSQRKILSEEEINKIMDSIIGLKVIYPVLVIDDKNIISGLFKAIPIVLAKSRISKMSNRYRYVDLRSDMIVLNPQQPRFLISCLTKLVNAGVFNPQDIEKAMPQDFHDFLAQRNSTESIGGTIIDMGTPAKFLLEALKHRRIEATSASAAMQVKIGPGGIDLTPANKVLQTKNSGGEIKFYLDPAMLKQLQNAPGLVPVIISVKPLKDLSTFLEVY